MAEEVAEVDVDELARLRQQHVVVVPVGDAEDVGGDAVARARAREAIDGALPQLLARVVLFEPLPVERLVKDCCRVSARLLDYACQGVSMAHDLPAFDIIATLSALQKQPEGF